MEGWVTLSQVHSQTQGGHKWILREGVHQSDDSEWGKGST